MKELWKRWISQIRRKVTQDGEEAAFVFVRKLLQPLREDYGSFKWPSNVDAQGSWLAVSELMKANQSVANVIMVYSNEESSEQQIQFLILIRT